MLSEWTILTLFHFFLLFARTGAALMVLPGFGEIYITARARLIMALTISGLMAPLMAPLLPPVPPDVLGLAAAIIVESLVGLFIGGIGRMLQSILHIAGMIIAFQSSLASALLFDANQGSQGSVVGNFMTLVGVTLLFVTGMHHLMLTGIVESYQIFPAGHVPPTGDMAEMASQLLSEGFLVAVKISAPLIVVGVLLYFGAGLLGRLMPSMQVFFVLVPIQLYESFVFLLLMFSAGMLWYLQHFEDVMRNFLVQPL